MKGNVKAQSEREMSTPLGQRIRSINNLTTVGLRCRICLDDGTVEALFTPCNCKGTMGYVHKSCLEEWLTSAQMGKCEICSYEFKMGKVYPSCFEWIKDGNKSDPENNRHLCADVLCLLVMLPLVFLCGFLSVHACRLYGVKEFHWEIFALAFLFMILLVIFLVWMLLAMNYHIQCWRIWRHRNQRMCIIDEKKKGHHRKTIIGNASDANKRSSNYSNENVPTVIANVHSDNISSKLQQHNNNNINNAITASPRTPDCISVGVDNDFDENYVTVPTLFRNVSNSEPLRSLPATIYERRRSKKIENIFHSNVSSTAAYHQPTIDFPECIMEPILNADPTEYNHSYLSPVPFKVVKIRESISQQKREHQCTDNGTLYSVDEDALSSNNYVPRLSFKNLDYDKNNFV